jgi:large subunit ribosomal protein L29
MDIKELRKKSEQELLKFLKLKREQMRDLRFQVAAKQRKDVRDLRQIKKDIAQILTVLKEKKVVEEYQKINKAKKIK